MAGETTKAVETAAPVAGSTTTVAKVEEAQIKGAVPAKGKKAEKEDSKGPILVTGVPDIVAAINKKYKTTKIAPLSQAKALFVKRYFSGSLGIDYLTGGGYTYKRILLLYGHKSSGKNSQLYQTIAYNQRICRVCHGVLCEHYEKNNSDMDRWTFVLKYFLNIPMCKCGDKGIPKNYILFDYEKSLGMEDKRSVAVRQFFNKETGEIISENTVNDARVNADLLKLEPNLTSEQKQSLTELNTFLANIDYKTETVERIAQTDYMINCGINTDLLQVVDPEDGNEGIDLIKMLIKSKEMDGIIWDSLQAATPKYVIDRSAEEATMGQEAKLNGLLMRQITAAYASENLLDESEAYKPTVFVTSQVRSDLGAMYAKPDTYSGGNSVHHHISLAMEVKREKFLGIDGREAAWGTAYYGQQTRVRAEKNKINSPGDMFLYDYYFRSTPEHSVGTIDHVGELISLGLMFEVIDQRGAWFYYKDYKANGKNDLRDSLSQDPEMVVELCADIYKRF